VVVIFLKYCYALLMDKVVKITKLNPAYASGYKPLLNLPFSDEIKMPYLSKNSKIKKRKRTNA